MMTEYSCLNLITFKGIVITAPTNQKTENSSDKLFIEDSVDMLSSSLWAMQHQLYMNASIRDYAFQKIPMGISSSSYIARVGLFL